MIDFDVAFDKLASFESAQEIADFLKGYQVKGYRFQAGRCPISRWMSHQTGLIVRTGNARVRAVHYDPDTLVVYGTVETVLKNTIAVKENTDAMRAFILSFDGAAYPDLIANDEPTYIRVEK